MIRHPSAILLVLLVAFLVACSPAAPQPAEGMIKPGHVIGDFEVTKGVPGDFVYTWTLDCPGPDNAYTCHAVVGTTVNVSVHVYEIPGKDLDTLWAGHTYEMTINGVPVDLKSFGPVEVVHPQVGKMRSWNVAVTASKPGELVIHSKGAVNSEPFEETMTLAFGNP